MGAPEVLESSIRVFISYAWECPDYREKVESLATRLGSDGITPRLDAWHSSGVTIPEFMSREIRRADKILILCSPEYRRRVHAMEDGERISGTGWEAMLLTSAIWNMDRDRDQIVAALFRGAWNESAPFFLNGVPYIDLTGAESFEAQYGQLVRQLKGQVDRGPEIRSEPTGFSAHSIVLRPPGLWRSLSDRVFPSLNSRLRRAGVVSTPPEYDQVTDHLRSLRSNIENDIARAIYVPNRGRWLPRLTYGELPGDDPFLRPVQYLIRAIQGRDKGGDSASAQIAVVNRKSKTIRNILQVLRRTDEPLVLLGDPGTGKTMALQQSALALIEAELRRVFPIVVVYVRLGEFHYSSGPVTSDHVFSYVRSSAAPSLSHLVDALDRAGRLMIIFDGLDEMSRDRYTEHTEALSRFAGNVRGRTRTLFSCRITDFSPSFVHQRLVLLPFDYKQIHEYLRQYFNSAGEVVIGTEKWTLKRLARYLARSPFGLDATNPFILWLLCFHLLQRHAWPISRTSLLDFYLRENYRRKEEDAGEDLVFPPFEEAMVEWARFAYIIAENNRGTAATFSDVTARSGQDLERISSMVRLGRRCGVLVESNRPHPDAFRFDHHRLQEYFTALHIALSRLQVEWLSKLDAPRWQETLVNLAAMGGGEEPVIALCDAIQDTVTAYRAGLAADQEHWKRIERQARRKFEKLRSPASSASESAPAPEPATQHDSDDDAAPEAKEVKRPAFDPKSEMQLGDRVELAARILRNISDLAPVKEKLSGQVRDAVNFLTLHGNPITQLKMIRACIHIPDPNLITAVRRCTNSNVSWLRDQALIFLSASEAGLGAKISTELGYDLAKGILFSRWPTYLKAVRATAQPGATRGLFFASFCAVIHLFLLIAASAFVYAGTVRVIDWSVINLPLSHRLAVHVLRLVHHPNTSLAIGILTFLAICFTILKQPAFTWKAILGTPLIAANALFLVFALWLGRWGANFNESFFLLISSTVINVFLLWIATCLVGFVLHSLSCVLYLAMTARVRDRDDRLRHFLVSIWRECGYREMYIACMPIIVVGLLSLSVFPVLVAVKSLWWNHRHVTVVSFYLLASSAVCFVIVRYRSSLYNFIVRLYREPEVRMSYLWAAGILGMGVLGASGLYWALNYLGSYVAHGIAIILVGLMCAFCVWIAFLAFRRIDIAMRHRSYAPTSMTLYEWKRRLSKADAEEQTRMLLRTNHQTLGLSPAEFLALVQNISSLIKEDPALSAYWAHRSELEQTLKQENLG